MVGYIGKRLTAGLVSIFFLMTVTFFLTQLMPGSPFAGGNVSEAVQEAIEEEYGLNEPLMVQYKTYLINFLRGDFGISLAKPGVTVSEVIGRAWPATVSIGLPAIIVAAIFGTLFGVWQATARNRAVRTGIFLGTVLGSSMPNFVVAIMLLLVFGVQLKWFPIVGLTTPGNYVLPVAALALYPTSVITRLVQRAYEEEVKKEYVILTKAKGLKRLQILLFHVMRHVWIPVLNYLGPAAAFLITGSFVIESVFTISGLGREFVNAIANRDYTMIMGLTVFMGVVVIILNLITDILCAWLNPGMRKEFDYTD